MIIPDWLLEMSEQMRSQPSRATAHPFWQTRCEEYLPTLDGCNEHHIEICDGEGVVYKTTEPMSEFIDYLLDEHLSWCEAIGKEQEIEIESKDDLRAELEDMFSGEDFYLMPDGLRAIPVQKVEKVISTHFTEADARAFIARKQHDFPKLYTYVESAYWSPQLRQLQDWIIGLTNAPEKDAK